MELLKALNELDGKIDAGIAMDVDRLNRISKFKEFEEIEMRQQMDLAQKAKRKWDLEWDENSSFFHGKR